ncbi:MAG TPA: hypothetical protein VFA21_22465 [Pyrinomonadaceae bacterium]|jgi:hypothetical protein|nr:hypothetical protein [Pyrinomonadaceae bacterium]
MADKYQRYKGGNSVCNALRFLCDASFAVLPLDAAHKLGEFEKNIWGGVRWFAEKNVEWIDESLAAADWLREEWRRRNETHTTTANEGPETV